MIASKQEMQKFFNSLKRKGILVRKKTKEDRRACESDSEFFNHTILESEEMDILDNTNPLRSGTYGNWCNNNLVQFYNEDYSPKMIWLAIERCCNIRAEKFSELKNWNPYEESFHSFANQ